MNNKMQAANLEQPPYRRLFSFFIPLGISASLVTISHVIINSTLARASKPEEIVAGFAIAMSVFVILERPINLLRQTCSALIRSQHSFRTMAFVAMMMLTGILLFASIISYTTAGEWVFRRLFGIEGALLASTLNVYRILMFVTIFSAIRGLYHGIIISQMHTKWLTIGMIVRLTVMYSLSVLFISMEWITGQTGAVIFLSGMMVEALVGWLEGRRVYRKLPPIAAASEQEHNVRSIFTFYRPLVYSSFIAVIAPPAINAMLGKTVQIELAIASYAIALSIVQLSTSFFTYVHQVVLNFYRLNPRRVLYFNLMLGLLPALLTSLLAFTGAGPWFLENVIGVKGQFLQASIDALRIFIIFSAVLPWLDFGNGLLMLYNQTKYMVLSQACNIAVVLVTLFILVWTVPHWNGRIGSMAQSIGFLTELIVVWLVFRSVRKSGLTQRHESVERKS